MSKKIKKEIEDRKIAREITKTIIDYGVNDNQKLEIMHLLSLELESNDSMKEISKFLKKFTVKFNTKEQESNIEEKSSSLII
tara:strand:- start:112 stop:357 length:246 start_codon:yes stop_codon:yes gene_type:complete